jgi:uncharacterized membrane protein
MTKKNKRTRKKTRARANVQNKLSRNIILIAAALVGIAGYWTIVQISDGGINNYPTTVEAVGYSSPVVSSDGGSVTVPKDFVEDNKLVYVDLKLETPVEEFVYMKRRIPLAMYSEGEYLPMVIMYTPKGNTIAGIRVCEPCGSFDFHIVEKKYLQCDACGTRWNIETLQGISGGCQNYPPPELDVATTNGVEISLVSTGLKVLT